MQEYLSIVPVLPLQMKFKIIVAFCSILFASACIYIFWWYRRLIRTYAKFPSVRYEVEYLIRFMLGKYPKNVPLTSVLYHELRQIASQFQNEGYCVVWFFRPYLFVFNKEITKRLYTDPAIVNKSSWWNLLNDSLGNGLLTSKEEIWKKHRKMLDPVFYLGVLKGKLNIFNDTAAELVIELEKRIDQPTYLEGILKECTFNAMSRTILGLNLEDENYKERIVKYFNAVHDVTWSIIYRIVSPWLYWDMALPFFSDGRKYLRARDCVRNFTIEVLSELKTSVVDYTESEKVHECGVENKKSLIRILLEQHLKDSTFTIKDIQDHVTTIIGAGHDTISCTLMWCFYTLGLHPEVQEKAFKEIDALTGADITYEELCQLKYLNCFIKETLRLYPTVPIFGRKLNKDIHMEDYTIPKGTETIFFIYELHRRPDLFPDPEKFDPERFSGDSNKVPSWAFLPFAEGYRSCIGKKFAMMELKVILSHIIRRFKIETLEKIDASHLDWKLTMVPTKPVSFLFTLR